MQIINRLGLHARAAAKLVHTANSFRSQIFVGTSEEEVNAKSILGLLTLLQSHVPEAVSIPLDQLEASVTRLRAAGLRVVTYCASTTCERSARAAMMLRRLGVPEVQALDGGFPAWVASGRVVVVQPTS